MLFSWGGRQCRHMDGGHEIPVDFSTACFEDCIWSHIYLGSGEAGSSAASKDVLDLIIEFV